MTNVQVIQRHAHLASAVKLEFVNGREGKVAKATLIAFRATSNAAVVRTVMMNAPSGQEHVGKKSKFTEEPVAFASMRVELGTRVEEVCCKADISDATVDIWKKCNGGVGTSTLRRLRQAEKENRKLQQIVANRSMDKAMLMAVVARNF